MKRDDDNRLLYVWRTMKARCYNKNVYSYKNYGGRGISVCREWYDSFEVFESWALSNGYDKGLTIERIDVNGNYCPENCKWATRLEQCNNTRKNIRITYLGKTQTISQWARELNVAPGTLRRDYYKGYFPPTEGKCAKRSITFIEYQGKILNIRQWAEELGVTYRSLHKKVKRGTFPPTEENAHRRHNRLITYEGKSLTMQQWAEELKLAYGTIRKMVSAGKFPPKKND